MHSRTSRRRFLQTSALAGVGFWMGTQSTSRADQSPNEKLNLACIGVGGQGRYNVDQVASQNVVALCDVDEVRAGKTFEAYPRAQRFADFRKMLDKIHNKIDGVVVATPDHTHAPVGMAALARGKHLYLEKPLAHNVAEVRLLTEAAAKHKVVTQMGTQIHSTQGYRRVVELVKAGVIGTVREAHGWCSTAYTAGKRPTEKVPMPPTLHWDLWLGPAPERLYNPCYLPFTWRGWRDFGTGGSGDMACHILDPIFWALELKYPLSVQTEGVPMTAESHSPKLMATYEFAARSEKLPALTVKWYTGHNRPDVELPRGIKVPGSGQLFVGDKGMLLSAHTSGLVALLPEKKFAEVKLPEPFLPKPPGHHGEWIAACKKGGTTGCNFGYAGPLAETVLLSNVGLLVGKKFKWDGEKLRSPDCPQASDFLRRTYRKGWELPV